MKSEKLETEQYKFLRFCEMDVEETQQTLGVLINCKDNKVYYPLLRDIVVTYARPFSDNRGIEQLSHKLKKSEFVPKKYYPLHELLMNFRNTIFAHTDIGAKDAKVSRWRQAGYATYPMSFRRVKYEALIAELGNLKSLLAELREKLLEKIRRIQLAEETKIQSEQLMAPNLRVTPFRTKGSEA
jgi:hypothetical protein